MRKSKGRSRLSRSSPAMIGKPYAFPRPASNAQCPRRLEMSHVRTHVASVDARTDDLTAAVALAVASDLPKQCEFDGCPCGRPALPTFVKGIPHARGNREVVQRRQ